MVVLRLTTRQMEVRMTSTHFQTPSGALDQPFGRLPAWGRIFRPREMVEKLFALADVRFDGLRPWDITVHDERLFRRILANGSLGFGESYMDGDWDCAALDQLFHRVISARLGE